MIICKAEGLILFHWIVLLNEFHVVFTVSPCSLIKYNTWSLSNNSYLMNEKSMIIINWWKHKNSGYTTRTNSTIKLIIISQKNNTKYLGNKYILSYYIKKLGRCPKAPWPSGGMPSRWRLFRRHSLNLTSDTRPNLSHVTSLIPFVS